MKSLVERRKNADNKEYEKVEKSVRKKTKMLNTPIKVKLFYEKVSAVDYVIHSRLSWPRIRCLKIIETLKIMFGIRGTVHK